MFARLVKGDLRSRAAEPQRKTIGQWSGEILGVSAKVPRGGITLRLLHAVRVRAYLQGIAAKVERFRKESLDAARDFGWGHDETMASGNALMRRAGVARGRSDAFYARIAEQYTKAITRKSRRPIHDIARSLDINTGQARDIVRQARKLRLLTATNPGERGGILTERALVLLRKAPRAKRRSHRLTSD
jgi:hypothetical protein